MSAQKTFTVTVATGQLYLGGGATGNVYYIDSTRNDPLVTWVRGGTARFEQSDSSNDNHPLLFTNSLDDVPGGRITTGVTYYLDGSVSYSDWINISTFNAATTRYIEFTPAQSLGITENAPYIYCYVHGIGMGGSFFLSNNTFGALDWSNGFWNEQNNNEISLTGFGLTSSVGDGENMGVPQTGWGGTNWSNGEWGQVNDNGVELTGFGLTTSLNAEGVLSYSLNGWGRNTWSSESWGESDNPVVTLTGSGLTSSVGDGTNIAFP